MGTNSALDSVMDQAANAAQNFQAPAVAPNTSLTQAAPAGNQLSRPSLDSFVDSGGIQVDYFLAVDKAGLQLGDMKKYFEEFTGTIDMTAVVPIYVVRGNTGGQTKFIKSYDGVTTSTGEGFTAATDHLRRTQEKVDGPYPSAEIPVVLDAEISHHGVTVEVGKTVGITPSLTGFDEFRKFVKELKAKGLEQSKVAVKVSYRIRENSKKNTWGVPTFEFLGEAVDGD